jgi:hypothetical protein
MSVLELIADVLSIITIALCLILKIPQIVNVLKLKSAVGINLYALLMELTRYVRCMFIVQSFPIYSCTHMTKIIIQLFGISILRAWFLLLQASIRAVDPSIFS